MTEKEKLIKLEDEEIQQGMKNMELVRIFNLDKFGKVRSGAEYYVKLPSDANIKYLVRVRVNDEVINFKRITNSFGYTGNTLLDGLNLRTFDIKKAPRTKAKGDELKYNQYCVEDYKKIRLIKIDNLPVLEIRHD